MDCLGAWGLKCRVCVGLGGGNIGVIGNWAGVLLLYVAVPPRMAIPVETYSRRSSHYRWRTRAPQECSVPKYIKPEAHSRGRTSCECSGKNSFFLISPRHCYRLETTRRRNASLPLSFTHQLLKRINRLINCINRLINGKNRFFYYINQ